MEVMDTSARWSGHICTIPDVTANRIDNRRATTSRTTSTGLER